MKTMLLITGLTMAMLLNTARAADNTAKETRFFEMRTYYAAPGKLDDLLKRFREHTCELFKKHGMENIGYWTPLTNTENKLIYVLAYPTREAREKSWHDFMADPDWRAAQKASEVNGKLVDKVDSVYMTATDFSPVPTPSAGPQPRTFELRQYTCTPGHLPNLLERFRDHTVALFTKHGMTHIGYWTPADKAKGADDTLIYILAHKSPEACAESFKNFRADPDWIAVKKASEDKAGGSLTVTNGVKSTLMVPTDFSPIK